MIDLDFIFGFFFIIHKPFSLVHQILNVKV